MRHYLLTLILLITAGEAAADGFRCGRKLVVTGDPVSRLTRACGRPDHSFRARVAIGDRGQKRSVSVMQWVYLRQRGSNLIVSVSDGIVVAIDRD